MTEHLDRGETFATDGWGSESNDYLNPDGDGLDYEEDEYLDSDEYWEDVYDDDDYEEDDPYYLD